MTTMKLTHWTIGGIALLALATSANAGSVNDQRHWTNFDKIRDAINNPMSPGQAVDLPTVDVKGVEIKGREVPMRDLSARPTTGMRDVTTVEQKSVDVKRREISIYNTTLRGTPVSNFTAKHASIANGMHSDASKMYAVDHAPIPSRRIVVASPEGLEELRKQLNRIP